MLRKIRAGDAGDAADIRVLLREFLQQKCRADGHVSGITFALWVVATIVFAGSVGLLILGDGASDLGFLDWLPSMEDTHLQAIAGAFGVVSSVLFMTFLRLRQEQTKHTFLLIMVMEGSVKDAASILFGHREGKASTVMDAAEQVLGSLS